MAPAEPALVRRPEPELMDSPAQVQAYAAADFTESNRMFVDRLVADLTGRPPGRLIDLGCGPGDILIRLAKALPDWELTGLDAGENMLAEARRAVAAAGLENRIRLHHARLPDTGLVAASFDCVASNSLLHHLPEPDILWRAVRELAAPGARVQVMDLDRPTSMAHCEALLERHAAGEPEVLREDFRNSLIAAWRAGEVRDQLVRAGLALDCQRVSDRHWLVAGVL